MKKLLLLTALILLLGACNSAEDEFDRAFVGLPTVEVDRTIAEVGELVEVTLSGSFMMYPQSRRAENRLEDVVLGACFGVSIDGVVNPNGPFGRCQPLGNETPLPHNPVVSDGSSYLLDAGEVVVKRGQTRTLEHTFTFTLSEPREVNMHSVLQFVPERYPVQDFVDSAKFVTVTFE